MKHTPGPWHWNSTNILNHNSSIKIASIPEKEGWQANARLIASAPDLLAALQHLTATARSFRNVPKDEQEWTSLDDAALEEAFAAIRKATGE